MKTTKSKLFVIMFVAQFFAPAALAADGVEAFFQNPKVVGENLKLSDIPYGGTDCWKKNSDKADRGIASASKSGRSSAKVLR